jgi:putative colanic acid biosynthesis acetyltransferase WcaF
VPDSVDPPPLMSLPEEAMSPLVGMRLDLYSAKSFDRGRSAWLEALWLLAQRIFLSSPLSGTRLRVLVLRLFGARIGRGVVIKSGVRVKFPWRLQVGDHCWIGQDVWLDNLAEVHIGNHCCLSQGAYLCTGSHDWGRVGFDLVVKPIILEDEVWIAARAVMGPGVVARRGAVLGLGSVATHDLWPWYIHQGLPAVAVRRRRIASIPQQPSGLHADVAD